MQVVAWGRSTAFENGNESPVPTGCRVLDKPVSSCVGCVYVGTRGEEKIERAGVAYTSGFHRGGGTIVIKQVDGGITIKQELSGFRVSAPCGHVEGGTIGVIAQVWLQTCVQAYF